MIKGLNYVIRNNNIIVLSEPLQIEVMVAKYRSIQIVPIQHFKDSISSSSSQSFHLRNFKACQNDSCSTISIHNYSQNIFVVVVASIWDNGLYFKYLVPSLEWETIGDNLFRISYNNSEPKSEQ